MTEQRPSHDVFVLIPGIMGSVLEKDGKDIWALSSAGFTGSVAGFDRICRHLGRPAIEPRRPGCWPFILNVSSPLLRSARACAVAHGAPQDSRGGSYGTILLCVECALRRSASTHRSSSCRCPERRGPQDAKGAGGHGHGVQERKARWRRGSCRARVARSRAARSNRSLIACAQFQSARAVAACHRHGRGSKTVRDACSSACRGATAHFWHRDSRYGNGHRRGTPTS